MIRTTWVHSYMKRTCTAWMPGKVHATLLRAGWTYPNTQGRVKCSPIDGEPFTLVVYIVPAKWVAS